MLEVIEPGLFSTIQDEGRPGAADLGVPRGGACDPLALAVLRGLVDCREPSTAALEMTLVGPVLAVREDCLVGLSGADLRCEVVPEGRALHPGTTALVRAGTTLRFGEGRDGARGYLSLAGGISCERVLGSASTCLVGGFGGFGGRRLATGDVLRPVRRGLPEREGPPWPGPVSGVVSDDASGVVRIVPGPHADAFPVAAQALLESTDWQVSSQSDRVGLRLDGPPIPRHEGSELPSLGMVWGAIQAPSGGGPIVLLADHQTVGGYPVIAVAISVDRPILGQLRAGDRVRFRTVTLEDARRLRLVAQSVLRDQARAWSGSFEADRADDCQGRSPDPRA